MPNKSSAGLHDGHRDRMREKFRKSGFNGMEPHEILEMLLYYSVPRKDTNELAHMLINHFGSLAGVLEASEEELVKVKGITSNSATLIRMILPLYNRYSLESNKTVRLKTPNECGAYLKEYFAAKTTECVAVVCIDGSCRVLCVENICEGDATSVILNVRKIVELVMKFPKTTAVIIAHNHPGGLALPSRDDVDATQELIKTLSVMGIYLADHIIVNDEDYISMASSVNFRNLFRQ